MPSSTTRDALSRSMANIDYQAAPGSRRATRQKPNKRDTMSQSCSAFNYVLDASEIGTQKANGSSSLKKRSSRDKSRDRSGSSSSSKPSSSSSKPSYSDLVMDATSKSHFSTQAESLTSAMESEGGEKGDADKNDTAASAATTASSRDTKPTRSIPTGNNISRRQIMGKSKSFHEGNEAARSRRPKRSHSIKLASRSGHALHMSMQDFPEPSDFQRSNRVDSPALKSRNERFSQSFSGFDDWDPGEFTAAGGTGPGNSTKDAIAALSTTPSRRRGKRPVGIPPKKIKDCKSRTSTERSHDFASAEIHIDGSLCSSGSGNNYNNNNSNNPRINEGDDDDNNNSITEMDLLSGVPQSNSKSGPDSFSNRRNKRRESFDRFSHSFSSFEALQDLVSTTSGSSVSTAQSPVFDPKSNRPRRRRSSMDRELAQAAKMLAAAGVIKTKVETEKVSVDEFQAIHVADEEKGKKDSPARPKRSFRDKRTNSSGNSSCRNLNGGSPRIRRAKSHDGSIRPIRTDGGGGRRPKSSQDPAKQRLTQSVTTGDAPATLNSLSRRKSCGVPAGTAVLEPGKPSQRSTSRDAGRRRRKSVGPSGPADESRRRRKSVGPSDPADADRRRQKSAPRIDEIETTELQDSPEQKSQQRRVPRQTRSGDMSRSVREFSPMQASGGDCVSSRPGPRRTKSSGGSVLQASFRRLASASDSPSKKPSDAVVGRPLISPMSKSRNFRRLPSRSLSSSQGVRGGIDLSPGCRTDRSARSASRSRGKPTTRRKLPSRSKSHDESSFPLAKLSSRDREKSGDNTEGRQRRRRRSSTNPSAATSGNTGDSNTNVATSAAERRAMAHAIMS